MPLSPLFGHTVLRDRLSRSVVGGTLPASLLFHGAAGVGKQRLALWLAQRMLCEKGAAEPCGECQPCQYTLRGVHPDVHWFFPIPKPKGWDSDPSLEQVSEAYGEARAERLETHGIYPRPDGSAGLFIGVTRAIVQAATRTPAMAKRKVFIIGDAERMTSQSGSDQAANAFLKLLEEPLPDTTIILTSSEVGALLPTIRSRVVALRVAPLRDADVRAFASDPDISKALEKRGVRGDASSLVRVAHGAPGALLGGAAQDGIKERAKRMLDAAGAGRERALRVSYAQSSTKARGAYSDVLDALTVALHERTQEAVDEGNAPRARGAARAVVAVEVAKRATEVNANPQILTANLLRTLADLGV